MLERDKDLEHLQIRVVELERVRSEQASKIASLLGNVDDVNREFTDKREVANNTIAALTSELRTTRTALDDTQKREQQVTY
jgi:ABC-type transporter Mla subunit MlaD